MKLLISRLRKAYQKSRVILSKCIGTERKLVNIDTDLIMDIRYSDTFAKPLLFGASPEPAVASTLLEQVKPEMTVLDVGANIGYMSLICSKAVGSAGLVLSIEPNPLMFSELEHNIIINNILNVKTEQIALSDIDGEIELFLPRQGKESHSSIKPNSTFISEGSIIVKAETLDFVINRLRLTNVHIIKIDVEGAELLVLKGAKNVLRNMRPILIFESAENLTIAFGHSVYDVLSFVSSYKYVITQIDHGNWLAIPK